MTPCVAPQRRRNRAEPGDDCARCTSRSVVGKFCEDCWFSNVAWNATKSRKNKDMILELWDEQEGLCAYTREVLIVGEAGLDHKVPISRGGDHSKENLCWATSTINRVKTDLTEEEFFSMCEFVTSNRK